MSTDFRDLVQAALTPAYEIERELVGGGMSRVYLATEVALGRKVVVKVLPPEVAAGVSAERFRREIQLAAQLQHPHIVPLLSAGVHGREAVGYGESGFLYYTMPFIEGHSLRSRLASTGRLPVRAVVRILHDVVDALAYAHGRGVVHRDIKPDNILTLGTHALVTDFGVAKALSAAMPVSGMTTAGVAIGTPAYMAPEQLAGDPAADHRMDLYAVGLLAYELLTGESPFTGPSPQATMAAQLTRIPVALDQCCPDVPGPLSAVIMRCLEKSPEARPQTADELLAELDAVTTPQGALLVGGVAGGTGAGGGWVSTPGETGTSRTPEGWAAGPPSRVTHGIGYDAAVGGPTTPRHAGSSVSGGVVTPGGAPTPAAGSRSRRTRTITAIAAAVALLAGAAYTAAQYLTLSPRAAATRADSLRLANGGSTTPEVGARPGGGGGNAPLAGAPLADAARPTAVLLTAADSQAIADAVRSKHAKAQRAAPAPISVESLTAIVQRAIRDSLAAEMAVLRAKQQTLEMRRVEIPTPPRVVIGGPTGATGAAGAEFAGIDRNTQRALERLQREGQRWEHAGEAAAKAFTYTMPSMGFTLGNGSGRDGRQRVIVLPPRNISQRKELQSLADPMGDSLRRRLQLGLQGNAYLETMDATIPARPEGITMSETRKLGADITVAAQYYLRRDSLVVQTILYDARTGRTLHAVVGEPTSVDAPFRGLDALGTRTAVALAKLFAVPPAAAARGMMVPKAPPPPAPKP